MGAIRSPIAVLAIAMLALAGACGGGSSSSVNTTPSADAEFVRDQVVEAMENVESYHIEFSMEGQHGTWAFDYVAPDSYRVLLGYGIVTPASPGEFCYVRPDGATPGCGGVKPSVADTVLSETIYLQDKMYFRECAGDRKCPDWEMHDRAAMAASSPIFLPNWPLVALEMADLEQAANDGNDVVLEGSVNHLRAILENNRRVLDEAGITSFGTECRDVTAIPGPNGLRTAPPGSRECHELTYEESLDWRKSELTFFDDTPARVEITISSADKRLQQVVIDAAAPPGDDSPLAMHITITYSGYDSITLEAPE